MNKPRTKEKALKSVKQKAKTIARFMNSPVGSQVIRMLEQEFPTGVGKDPYDTYYKLGSRDVIEYLNQLKRIGEKDEEIQPET